MKAIAPGVYEIEGKHRPTYQVKWRRLDGSQASKNFRTRTEAKAFKAKVETEKRSGVSIDDRLAKVTFEQYAIDWVEQMKHHHRPSTAQRHRGILNKHLIPALGKLRLNQIRHSQLQSLVGQWQQQGLAPNTIINHVSTLNQILNLAVKDDVLGKNPAANLILPRPKQAEPRALEPEECTALIECIAPLYSPLVEVVLATGLRWSEAASLRIGDLNLLKQEITVRESKTEAGLRIIPIDEGTVAVIARHLEATGRTGAETDSRLFTSPTGEALNYSNFRTRFFDPACQQAGLADVTFHDLRRTHATMLVDAGVNPKVLQHRMGHQDIQTTLKIYASSTDRGRKEAANAWGQYMQASQPVDDTPAELRSTSTA